MILLSEYYVKKYRRPRTENDIVYSGIDRDGTLNDGTIDQVCNYRKAFTLYKGQCLMRRMNGEISGLFPLDHKGKIENFTTPTINVFDVEEETDEFALLKCDGNPRLMTMYIKPENLITDGYTMIDEVDDCVRYESNCTFADINFRGTYGDESAYIIWQSPYKDKLNRKSRLYISKNHMRSLVRIYLTTDMRRLVIMYKYESKVNGGFAIDFETKYIPSYIDLNTVVCYAEEVKGENEKIIIAEKHTNRILCTIDFSDEENVSVSFPNGDTISEDGGSVTTIFIKDKNEQ